MSDEEKTKATTPLSACEILEYLRKSGFTVSSTEEWLASNECNDGRVIKPSDESFYRDAIKTGNTSPTLFQSNAPYISKAKYHRLAEDYFKCQQKQENQDTTTCMEKLISAENAVRGYHVSSK